MTSLVRRESGLRTLTVVLWLACGCAPESAPRPDVALIVVDTLRADRLPFLGCARNTAPFLDELAERSLVFESAWSPSSWTLPATVSVLTSVHPFQHGVTDFVGLELEPGEEPVPVNCIPTEVETLAETLQAAGYRTFGIVSNILVGSEVGLDRGFDRFVRLDDEDADAVNALVASWRDEILAGEPFFLYVHYIDPHDTFHAREPWFDLEAAASDESWPDSAPTEELGFDQLDWIMTRLDPGPAGFEGKRASDMSPQELREVMTWIRAAYDSEIGFVDARIRALFESLQLDQAVVFFLADHGEEFFEHGDLTHGQNLYAETVRVPLLLYQPQPGARRGRVQANVSTLDIIPTLRQLIDLPPSQQDRGQDLLAAASVPRQPVLALLAGKSRNHSQDENLHSIVVGDLRLIAVEGGGAELYDIAGDPLETRDLAAERPDATRELLLELDRLQRSAPAYKHLARIPPPPSEAMREHLKGIGYAGDE
jgi:choline-sulfatase